MEDERNSLYCGRDERRGHGEEEECRVNKLGSAKEKGVYFIVSTMAEVSIGYGKVDCRLFCC